MSSNWQRRADGRPAGSGMLRAVHGVGKLFESDAIGVEFRADGIDTMIVGNLLEEMEAEVFRYDYPDVKTREIIPLDFSGDPGAETNAWQTQDGKAEWALLDQGADANDAPSQKMRREKDSVIYESFAHAFSYSINDIRRAAKAGIPLETEKAILARQAWEETLEDILATGYDGTQLRGLLDYPGVSSEDVNSWEDITDPELLLAAAIKPFNDRFATLRAIGGLIPNRHAIPLSVYMHLATTSYFTTSGTLVYNAGKSVLDEATQKIRQFSPDFEFIWWNKTEGAEPNGGARHRSILYRMDPRVLKLKSSVEFEMLPIQPQAFGFDVPCHTRTAGVMITKPLGVHYVDIAKKGGGGGGS